MPPASAGRVALVHNGIIENHEELRAALQARGYVFAEPDDTEVIAHLVDSLYQGDLFEAVQAAVAQLHGAYAIAVIHKDEPHRVVGARAAPAHPGRRQRRLRALPGQRRHGPGGRDRPDVYLEQATWWTRNWAATGSPPARRPLDACQRPDVRTVQAHSGAAELGLVSPLHAKGNF